MKIDIEPGTGDPVQDSLATVETLCRLAFSELNKIQSKGDEDRALLTSMQHDLNAIVLTARKLAEQRNGT